MPPSERGKNVLQAQSAPKTWNGNISHWIVALTQGSFAGLVRSEAVYYRMISRLWAYFCFREEVRDYPQRTTKFEIVFNTILEKNYILHKICRVERKWSCLDTQFTGKVCEVWSLVRMAWDFVLWCLSLTQNFHRDLCRRVMLRFSMQVHKNRLQNMSLPNLMFLTPSTIQPAFYACSSTDEFALSV